MSFEGLSLWEGAVFLCLHACRQELACSGTCRAPHKLQPTGSVVFLAARCGVTLEILGLQGVEATCAMKPAANRTLYVGNCGMAATPGP